MENIECGAGYHGIAHSVLLIQKTGIGAGLYIVPAAPFINYQGYALFADRIYP